MKTENSVVKKARRASNKRIQIMYAQAAADKRIHNNSAQSETARFWEMVHNRRM